LPGPILDVRVAAQRFTHKKFGSLEDFAATIGAPPPALGAGRAGARAALLTQILASWRSTIDVT
jgi:hypothetical protein